MSERGNKPASLERYKYPYRLHRGIPPRVGLLAATNAAKATAHGLRSVRGRRIRLRRRDCEGCLYSYDQQVLGHDVENLPSLAGRESRA